MGIKSGHLSSVPFLILVLLLVLFPILLLLIILVPLAAPHRLVVVLAGAAALVGVLDLVLVAPLEVVLVLQVIDDRRALLGLHDGHRIGRACKAAILGSGHGSGKSHFV